MQHVLIKTNQDLDALVQGLLPLFKQHLRVLHFNEDDVIVMNLMAAIDAIATYSDNDINETEYDVFYPKQLDYSVPSNIYGWYCGKGNIRDVAILDDKNHDSVADYTIDSAAGMIYPHPPTGSKISFTTGYPDENIIPPRLVNIIFRLGAEYHEMRESSSVERKHIPEWINYALASVWAPRV